MGIICVLLTVLLLLLLANVMGAMGLDLSPLIIFIVIGILRSVIC